MQKIGKAILGRHSVAPVDIFRFQTSLKVKVRLRHEREAIGSASFDAGVDAGGLIQPSTGQTYNGPNGLSMRPIGNMFGTLLALSKGEPKVFRIPCGTVLPDNLVLLHEFEDHFSLQTTVPLTPQDFEANATSFLNTAPVECMKREDLYARYPEMRPENLAIHCDDDE